MNQLVYYLILFALIAYWITPLVLIVLGLIKWKSKPQTAKVLLIIAATILVVGAGACSLIIAGMKFN
jgi:hypothetical protein